MPSPRKLVALVALLALSVTLPAAEPWADPKLTVRDGLELWLDANRTAGEKKAGANPVLAEWKDASGRGRHVKAPNAEAQPKRLAAGDTTVVRFDGIDDHLRFTKSPASLDSFTVIAVVVPRQPIAAFRGFLAFNAPNGRDYVTGLNIDFGPAPTGRFNTLNVEGRGFGGAQNLRTEDGPFGKLEVIEVSSDAAMKTVRVSVNGKDEGSRPRQGDAIALDEITVGGRFYNNAPGNQHADGFARCDIAEILVYNRVLPAAELATVRGYLNAKYAGLRDAPPVDGDGRGLPLVPVKDPPPVQVFVPGFRVRELPVSLTNVNNVKCRPDGTLVALGYDGTVWLVRDTDGDGLPDKSSVFWENDGSLRAPIGMDLTPAKYAHGDGLFIASKGRVSLITDTDGDGKADKVTVVADGWTEIKNNVDALGVAFDHRDGSVYFGRGCFDFTNGHRIGPDGKSAYKLTDETGTILRIAPDFKSREIVATGIRFPVAMRFNRHGDLFTTDQEGATWLPNGNPLDELLHIQKGRHYGFPPRHPKHLPNVIDEPSTFDYGPQHQSTCGLCFNDPVTAGGPTFGPSAWAGDAFVAGYSRGKLYRTQFVKSQGSYVAKNHLFACLNMLTADMCVTPTGGMVVACHSGGPDWGSGPKGKGKLYLIEYVDREIPQPVLVWPAGPREVHVAFDKPLDPEKLRDVVKQTTLTAGAHVRAGDRFESLWPGYAVVQAEKSAPRHDVPVRSVNLTADRRTLILATDPIVGAMHYALTLPGMGRPAKPAISELPQHPQIDLDFDLTGVEANWSAGWSGWLPHPELQVSRAFTTGSAAHDQLWSATASAGTLTIRTQFDMVNALQPAVQPGARLDHEPPSEQMSITFEVNLAKGTLAFNPRRNTFVPHELKVVASGTPPQSSLSYHTADDQRPRPLPLHRSLVPWAVPASQEAKPAEIPELAGGSWARGRREFFGEQAACGKCHTLHGRGGDIGPDLSNLIHRDYASVMRDITLPSFAINPDHLTYSVSLKDGRTLTGVVQSANDRIHVADTKGVITEISKSDVDGMKPSPTSTMPDGIPKLLGPERTRDLMTFLLTSPVSMPRDYAGPRPKPRPMAEVTAALAGSPNPPAKTRPLRIVLVAGPKDHGKGEHDYPAWLKAWKELMDAADDASIVTAWEWPEKDEFQKADVMVFFQHGDWNAKRSADIDAFLDRGGGLVYIHWAVDGRMDAPGFAKRIGLASRGGMIKFRHGPLDLAFNKSNPHPIARNFDRLKLVDESYWLLTGDLPAERVIATQVEEGQPRPLFWTVEHGKGRVFVSIPGHYSWSFDDPLFRILLFRGMAWSAKEPVDRFNDLVLPGADVTK